MNLAPYIKELVTLNECIILPDFGGFETKYAPAKYDPVSQQMLPPDKQVYFRPDYKIGGELLEKRLEETLKVGNTKAKELISEYIRQLKISLSEKGRFLIEEVGEFTVDSFGKLIFTAFQEENYLVESFGLEPLEIENIEIPEELVKVKRELKIRPRSNTLTFVLAGIFIVFILLALTVFISSKFDLYLFNIGSNQESNDMIILGGIPEKDSTYYRLEKTIDKTTDVKHALQFREEPKETAPVPSTYYILVAGSFKGYNNAQELQKRLVNDGFTVEIVEAGGHFRVSIGRFINKPEALQELTRIRTQINRSVWLLTVTDKV